jgi:outer membrane protein assembly factor BamB
VTITAAGATGSPAAIPVTLTVKPAAAVLTVTPATLSFTATAGGANPASQSLAVSNSGGGTLTFTSGSNQSWLTATPASGTAPTSETVAVNVAGLAAGSYTGQLTVTASGAAGSPATIPVSLSVANPTSVSADWPTVGQNVSRTSFASNDTVLNSSNIASLGLLWSANLDGKVSAQPLFLSAVTINSAVHDVVIACTNQDSVYALDADNGGMLWYTNLGPNTTGSPAGYFDIPGGTGIRSAPVVDRPNNRLFVVSDDGKLHTLSLQTGTELTTAFQVIDLPITNKVRGGLNLYNNNLYVASGSNGGDVSPWRGRIYQFNVSGTAPVLGTTFDVIPSVSGDNRGGGIWSYGGVSVDPTTGDVYAATGADYTTGYTPYAVRMLQLTPTLSLLGSYQPTHPATFGCSAAPCDVDFSATPTVFTATGCPQMVAAGNKDGHLYVMRTSDFTANSNVWQAITVNTADDNLGAGGLGGIPAFWAAGNMLFVTDSGNGVTGIPAGVIGLSMSAAPQCQLSVAWTYSLANLGSAQSSPTVVGNVVLVGEGGTGVVHAFDAATGTQLWNSGSTVSGNTYAAPTIGNGKVFVGSWTGSTAGDFGVVRAFSVGGTSTGGGCLPSTPPVLAGTQSIEPVVDTNVQGQAEAFMVLGDACGTVNSLNIYVDASSTAGGVVVGLYSDNAGTPGALLTQGSLSAPVAGAWNKITVPQVSVTTGTSYWIAVLGTTRGTLAFRDTSGSTCVSQASSSTSLTTLPATWVPGSTWQSCLVSAYAAP